MKTKTKKNCQWRNMEWQTKQQKINILAKNLQWEVMAFSSKEKKIDNVLEWVQTSHPSYTCF